MDLVLPLLASLAQAVSFTVDKTVLRLRHVTYKVYTGVSFPLLAAIDLVIFTVMRSSLQADAFYNANLLFLLLSVALTLGTNVIFYRALHDDTLSEMETINLFAIFPVIILSGIIFASERNVFVLAAAFIAGGAVVWSHWDNHRFKIAKKSLPFLFWVLAISPFASLINKELLYVWNPVALELVRNAGVAVILGPLFWRECKKIKGKAFGFLFITNALSAVAFILQGFSIQRSGIVYTALVFSLLPIFTYFSSVFILKEKIEPKKVAAFVVVLGAIIAAKLI